MRPRCATGVFLRLRNKHRMLSARMPPIVAGTAERVVTVEAELETPDGVWRVQIVRYGPRERWYRVLHAGAVVGERLPIAAVQRILGDAYPTLQPVEPVA